MARRHSRRLLVSVLTGLVTSVTGAGAQGLGYVVAGPSRVSGFFSPPTALHAAGGGEALFGGSVGIGGEVGLLATSGSVIWVASGNGVLHIPSRRRSPFVTGGYTRTGGGEGGFNAWNVGGGVDLWATERLGLRLDLRDHIRDDFRGTVHYWTVRGGLVFR
jgi:hypothetical protein